MSTANDNIGRITATSTSRDCIDTLWHAVRSAPSFFIRVHAAEALVQNGQTAGLEEIFINLKQAERGYATGATRVLARIYKNTNGNKYQACIHFIAQQYLHGDSAHPRLVALESLGKLEYQEPLPEIKRDAQSGEGGFKAMARWVLSNNGAKETEDSLAALLALPDESDYRTAAYALRFKHSVNAHTYSLLVQCAGRLNATDLATVYVLSARFVHAPAGERKLARQQLLQQVHGAPAAKYEIAEAFSKAGATEDLPLLKTLLHDADMDVRVAAANAILKIQQRSQTP